MCNLGEGIAERVRAETREHDFDILPRLKPWDSLEGGCHHHTV